MFYEEFEFFPSEDAPAAEYVSDTLKIIYYMPNIIDGEEDFMRIVTHEWLHGLFDWASEGATHKYEMIDAEGEHFVMRLLNYED